MEAEGAAGDGDGSDGARTFEANCCVVVVVVRRRRGRLARFAEALPSLCTRHAKGKAGIVGEIEACVSYLWGSEVARKEVARAALVAIAIGLLGTVYRRLQKAYAYACFRPHHESKGE